MKRIQSVDEFKEGAIITYCADQNFVEFKIRQINTLSIFFSKIDDPNYINLRISDILLSKDWWIVDDKKK